MLESRDELIERVADELRRPVRMDGALEAKVMAELRSQPRRRRTWFLRPRTVSLTPVGALALAASLVLVVAGTTVGLVRLREGPSSISSRSSGLSGSSVPFVLYAPGAHTVALVGDFNAWDTRATPLRATGAAGAWVVTVPLRPGRYRYAFLIDGARWVPDPGAPRAADDDFGTPNSVLTVGSL